MTGPIALENPDRTMRASQRPNAIFDKYLEAKLALSDSQAIIWLMLTCTNTLERAKFPKRIIIYGPFLRFGCHILSHPARVIVLPRSGSRRSGT
jgi:hypothetical protein